MSKMLDDFRCINDQCTKFDKVLFDVWYDTKEDFVPCEVCGKPMAKMPHAVKSDHISWSTWRI